MKTKIWSVFVATISTSLLAQTNAPEAMPSTATPAPAVTVPAKAAEPAPAVTNAPAKKKIVPRKKRKLAAAKEPLITEPTVVLVPGTAEVNAGNVNVRGQASFKGEVITRLHPGDSVTVLEQINLQKHRPDEPAQWAKIAYPKNANVWVNAKYIDADTKTVKPKKLNLRAGPGENYSVVGLIERGTPVSEISNKGEWVEIEPPANTYAFVAAMYLKQEVPAVATAAPPVETAPAPAPPPAETMPAPAPAPVTEAQPVTTTPAPAPAAPETNPAPAAAAGMNPPAVPAEQAPPSPPPPRVATHEGFVRHATSVIAPTAYELYDPGTGTIINYLYTPTTNLDLSRYNGLQIVVTGEEGLAERWKDTPVLTIQRIYVISTETNAVPRYKSVSPRTGHHY
ncbi:MAG: SH3 domain-containing protein [Verrucomicrobiota bacterium]|jgi:uncharacterized protein YgiM (DUF1202 family)